MSKVSKGIMQGLQDVLDFKRGKIDLEVETYESSCDDVLRVIARVIRSKLSSGVSKKKLAKKLKVKKMHIDQILNLDASICIVQLFRAVRGLRMRIVLELPSKVNN